MVPESSFKQHQTRDIDPAKHLAARVAGKLEEGDFRGAVRLAASSEFFATENDNTLLLLQRKHPPAHPDSQIPPFKSPSVPLSVTSSIVIKAISSFPSGSAAGPDGLRPQHLKDLVNTPPGDGAGYLADSLTTFVNLVLSGDVPPVAQAFFFEANLIGLNKKDGGIRPFAIGNTLRHLVAKCAGSLIKDDMQSLLLPLQLGYGTPRGVEAVVHSAHRYLSSLDVNSVMVKLDFSNALNSIRRDKILQSYGRKHHGSTPWSTPHTTNHPSCSLGNHPSSQLRKCNRGTLWALFCSVFPSMMFLVNLQSEFKVFYLDNGTLGGSPEDVRKDLLLLGKMSDDINLALNLK